MSQRRGVRRAVDAARGVAMLALLVLGTQARAETLEDAWQAALANNARVRAAQARADGAVADFDAAVAARRPAVVATSSVNRFADPPALSFPSGALPGVVPLFGGNSVALAAAQVVLPVYSGGSLGATVSAAAARVTAEKLSSDAVVAGTKLAVAEAYVAVLRAGAGLAAQAAAVASLAAHERDAADMEARGQVPRSDRLAAAVSLATGEQRRLEAENALALARSIYNRTLARPLAAAVELASDLALPAAVSSLPLPELVAKALASRAELHALTAVAMDYGARAAAKRAELRPQVTLTGGYNFIENRVLDREDYWSIGLGVRWTLFDSGRTRSAAAALARNAAAAAADSDELRASIELEVREAWLALGAARARRGVAEQALAQADENLRVVNDRYRNGEGTSSEALDAEALRSSSQSNLDTARFDAALAEVRLAYAAGAL